MITIGIIGCGYWGPNLIRNFRSLPKCHLGIVCDVNQERLAYVRGLYPELEATKDFDHLVNDEEIDAIAIATPVWTHFGLAKKSLSSGKNTFIEKPMASSAAECQELIDIAESKNLTIIIGHTFIYSPSVRKIKEIISDGDLGEIQYISARRLNLGLFQKDINVLGIKLNNYIRSIGKKSSANQS